MASGDTLFVFHPYNNEPPAATGTAATLDLRNNHPVLDFNPTFDTYGIFTGLLSRAYGGGGLTINIHWSATTSTGTSTSCRWQASIEALIVQDLDADGFAAAQSGSGNPNAELGVETLTAITFTNGAQMDSLAAGEPFRLKINRDADGSSGTDDMVGDAELIFIEGKET